MFFAPMIFTELDRAMRSRRLLFGLIAGVSLGLLSGCGGGWQPDPRDKPQSPARSGIEGSGLTGPDEAGSNL